MVLDKPIRLEVTAQDVKRGKQRDCRRCPIARALYRGISAVLVDEMIDYVDVMWHPNTGQVFFAYGPRHLLAPECVATFVDRFDWGHKVSPLRVLYLPPLSHWTPELPAFLASIEQPEEPEQPDDPF